MGAFLEPSSKEHLIQLLHNYVEVFAWSYEDIPGLDADIVVHHLPMREDCPPVKKKIRRMRPDMSEKIKAEVMKQFNAGFLAITSYPQRVSNIVPVPKKDCKERMCMDYKDLNRASPKDDFPLPHIDILVDHNTKCFPSWTASLVTIRSRWHPKAWKKQPLSHNGALSATK